MKSTNLEEPIPITRDIHWVGFTEESTRLKCNPYLLDDDQDVILFDPGSIPDFSKVMRKVIDLIPPDSINWIIVSHQDPDVCGNLSVVEDVIDTDALNIVSHKNTWRLIQHLGLRSPNYDIAANNNRITLKSGRILEFIPIPFLHSPGAIMTYDHKSGSLFSGDLFGAITRESDLFSDKGYPQAMESFHQAYMPSNIVLQHSLKKLKNWDIERILPQHGNVIEGENVQKAINYLMELPCGIDLME